MVVLGIDFKPDFESIACDRSSFQEFIKLLPEREALSYIEDIIKKKTDAKKRTALAELLNAANHELATQKPRKPRRADLSL